MRHWRQKVQGKKGKGKKTKAMDDTPLDVSNFQVNEAEELKDDIISPLFFVSLSSLVSFDNLNSFYH